MTPLGRACRLIQFALRRSGRRAKPLTMPSHPSAQACLKMIAPSLAQCSLNAIMCSAVFGVLYTPGPDTDFGEEEAARIWRRREFVALLASSMLALPLTAWAQQKTKVYRIAILHPSRPVSEMTETSNLGYYRGFFEELRRLGYVEGPSIVIERYSGEGRAENYSELARKSQIGIPTLCSCRERPWRGFSNKPHQQSP